jgi:hypothetical protein
MSTSALVLFDCEDLVWRLEANFKVHFVDYKSFSQLLARLPLGSARNLAMGFK